MAQLQSPVSKFFREYLDNIERRALHAGTTLTAVCREIGISRSTPDRWRRDLPRTIALLERMDKCVATAEKRKSGRASSSRA